MKNTIFERRLRTVVAHRPHRSKVRIAPLSIVVSLSLALPAGLTRAETAAPTQGSAAPAASTQSSADTAAKSMQELAGQAFASHCAQCHAFFGTEGFMRLTPAELYSVLRHGQMQEPATGLDDGTLHALAETFGNPQAASQRPPNGAAVMCAASKPSVGQSDTWSGFSADSTQARSVDRPFTRADLEGAKLKWTFAVPDSASGFWVGGANPLAVAHGRLYATNINGWIYALDPQEGCAYWTFKADAALRAGAAVDSGMVVIGDVRGNVYGLDEETGQLRWRDLADDQSFARITGTPNANRGNVFVGVSFLQEVLTIHPELSCCTASGSTVAYDIRSGERLWQTHLIDQPMKHLGKTRDGVNRFGPSGVGLLASPTVDVARNRVYVSTGNQTTGPFVPESDAVVAFDLTTGAKQWVVTLAPEQFGGQDIYNAGCETWLDPTRSRCPPENPGPDGHGDREFAAPVMLIRKAAGGDVLIAGSKDGMLYALDPDAKGKLVWQLRVGKGSDFGGIQYGMASDGKVIYAPVSDIDVGTQKGDGALNAVDIETGKRIWRTPVPADGCKDKKGCLNGIVSPPVVIGDVVIVGAMDGVLRGYEKKTGRQFWSFDSFREFDGVNGHKARGGSFGMGGATIVGNMMYIYSGSGVYANMGMKGNVLLAFELGKTATQH